VDAVAASPDTVDVFNPKVVQATMGAIFRVPFRYTSIPGLCREAISRGGKAYGTFLDGEDIYTKDLETGSDSPVVIVIGNESNGISPETEKEVSDRLFIPPYPADDPGSESLNAAVATALVTSEFRRRKI
jgi:TrmH family RNA methyltransferase